MVDIVTVENLKAKIEEIERKNGSQKVCIVGIVGRFHLFQEAATLNQLLNHDVLKQSLYDVRAKSETNVQESAVKQVEIRLFYDEEQKTVFLQLNSVHDYSHLVKACRAAHHNLSMAGRHHYWQNQLLKHASALLFMFSVSHIVVVAFPTPRFDLTYLRLFKMLASARYNMLHGLSQSLASLDLIPEIWRTTGRPCIPRIIFSFQIPWSSAKSLNENSVRKLQQSLQDQVHLILKKNRLLGSLSSSSLFTVSSPNQLFVHVQLPQKTHVNPVAFCINYVLKNSINIDTIFSSTAGKKSDSSLTSQPSPVKNSSDDLAVGGMNTSLREFLYKQIDYMMTVESREVPAEGRRGTHVEAPNICLWYKVCAKVFEYFLGNTSDNSTHLKGLAQSMDLDWKFSENRCHKVTPIATNTYLENLPSHYTQSLHLGRLNHCLHVFTMNARGPAFEHYAQQLQDECHQVWWNDRHLCETTSMTGQPCVYPYHNLPNGQNDISDDKNTSLKAHSSRVTTLAACNCGRTQGTREDPFDLKSANYEFYQDLEKKCCSYLLHMTFPSYPADDPIVRAKTAPSLQKKLETHQITILGRNSKTTLTELSEDYKSAKSQQQQSQQQQQQYSQYSQQNQMSQKQDQNGDNTNKQNTEQQQQTSQSSRTRTVSASKDLPSQSNTMLSYVQSNAGEDEACYVTEFEGMVQGTKKISGDALHCRDSSGTHDTDDSNLSTYNYFEGMFTTNLPPSILPMFPSWSLIMLGSASLYNPSKGVEQVGFFAGSNYLLLWDIPVDFSSSATESNDRSAPPSVQTEEEQWPAPGEVIKPKPPAANQTNLSSNVNTYIPFFLTMTQVQTQANELFAANRPVVGKTKRPNSKETTSVKAYIGHEYECPRGHRFICSAPDKMVKASASGHIRENASKLVTGNMPVYFPCPCRSSKPLHLAQITRTYAVTPDCPVTITLNPRVQPGEVEVTPVFFAGIKDGITLPPNSYCVLRYPYVYVDENGPILPPAPSQPLLTCRLLKGMFSYSYVQSSEDAF